MSATENPSVPFLDIRAQNQSIWSELQEALDEVIPQAQFVLGPAVERFETAFAKYIGRELKWSGLSRRRIGLFKVESGF